MQTLVRKEREEGPEIAADRVLRREICESRFRRISRVEIRSFREVVRSSGMAVQSSTSARARRTGASLMVVMPLGTSQVPPATARTGDTR